MGKLRDGDPIVIDADSGSIDVDLPEAEFESRQAAELDLDGNRFGTGRELFGRVRHGVSDAEQGASALFE